MWAIQGGLITKCFPPLALGNVTISLATFLTAWYLWVSLHQKRSLLLSGVPVLIRIAHKLTHRNTSQLIHSLSLSEPLSPSPHSIPVASGTSEWPQLLATSIT